MAIEDNASIALIPSGYKSGKLYSVIPDSGNGDFTHSRGSTATRVAASGLIETVASGVPRLDYPLIDGVVQDCPDLLLEPQRTNEVSNSENIQATNYANGNINSSINQTISPDGSQTADKIQNVVNSNQHFLQYIVSGGTANTATISVFFKYIDEPFIQIGNPFNGSIYANFDILNKNVGSKGGAASNQKIEDYGNGWVRCSVTFNNTGVNNQYIRFYFIPSLTSAAFPTYTPSAATSIFIWGLQAENASYSTSYIPSTSGSPTTRSADVCNGSGTSAEFNDSEGVLFAETSTISDSTFKRISIDSGSYTNSVVFDFDNTNNLYSKVFVGGSAVSTTLASGLDIDNNNKLALKYKSGDYALWVNGFEFDGGTNTSTPTGLNSLNFELGGFNHFYGKTKQLMTFKTALTDSELETLTSWDSFNAMAKGQLYTIE